MNGASGRSLRRSCDINVKVIGALASNVPRLGRAAVGLQLLIGRRLEELQDTTKKGPSNKFAIAMGKFARVLKLITTEADEFEGELREFYLELTNRAMYIDFVLKEVLPL